MKMLQQLNNKYVAFTVAMTSHVIYVARKTCSLNTAAPTRKVLSSFTNIYYEILYHLVWDFEIIKSNIQCISAESTSVLLTADYQTLRTEACYFLLQPELPVTGNTFIAIFHLT
jgi:hypothetical protein